MPFTSTHPPPTHTYTLSLHDALPIASTPWRAWARSREPASIARSAPARNQNGLPVTATASTSRRSEEHTSELQSLRHLVCRLLLEKKKKKVRLFHPALVDGCTQSCDV